MLVLIRNSVVRRTVRFIRCSRLHTISRKPICQDRDSFRQHFVFWLDRFCQLSAPKKTAFWNDRPIPKREIPVIVWKRKWIYTANVLRWILLSSGGNPSACIKRLLDGLKDRNRTIETIWADLLYLGDQGKIFKFVCSSPRPLCFYLYSVLYLVKETFLDNVWREDKTAVDHLTVFTQIIFR